VAPETRESVGQAKDFGGSEESGDSVEPLAPSRVSQNPESVTEESAAGSKAEKKDQKEVQRKISGWYKGA
jgi:hypothetical protein